MHGPAKVVSVPVVRTVSRKTVQNQKIATGFRFAKGCFHRNTSWSVSMASSSFFICTHRRSILKKYTFKVEELCFQSIKYNFFVCRSTGCAAGLTPLCISTLLQSDGVSLIREKNYWEDTKRTLRWPRTIRFMSFTKFWIGQVACFPTGMRWTLTSDGLVLSDSKLLFFVSMLHGSTSPLFV